MDKWCNDKKVTYIVAYINANDNEKIGSFNEAFNVILEYSELHDCYNLIVADNWNLKLSECLELAVFLDGLVKL